MRTQPDVSFQRLPPTATVPVGDAPELVPRLLPVDHSVINSLSQIDQVASYGCPSGLDTRSEGQKMQQGSRRDAEEIQEEMQKVCRRDHNTRFCAMGVDDSQGWFGPL